MNDFRCSRCNSRISINAAHCREELTPDLREHIAATVALQIGLASSYLSEVIADTDDLHCLVQAGAIAASHVNVWFSGSSFSPVPRNLPRLAICQFAGHTGPRRAGALFEAWNSVVTPTRSEGTSVPTRSDYVVSNPLAHGDRKTFAL